MIRTVILVMITRAWCALADVARAAMIAANRRWLAADDKLAGRDCRAWQAGIRARRLGRAHGHYRAVRAYRRLP